MNKKKHLNIIDIILILLILAVAAAAYFISHRDVQPQQTVPCSYVIECYDLAESMADTVKVGDSVTDNVRNYYMGTVTKVVAAPCLQEALDEEEGILRQEEVPGRINLLITVQADTLPSDSAIYTDSGYLVRIGSEVSCSAGQLYCVGSIVGIER